MPAAVIFPSISLMSTDPSLQSLASSSTPNGPYRSGSSPVESREALPGYAAVVNGHDRIPGDPALNRADHIAEPSVGKIPVNHLKKRIRIFGAVKGINSNPSASVSSSAGLQIRGIRSLRGERSIP